MMRRCAVVILALVLLGSIVGTRNSGEAASPYTDIATHWAKAYIEQLYALGALDDPPPYFRPNDPMARGKFARYVCCGWGIQPYTGATSFLRDVPAGHPYHPYVSALYTRRLMVGIGDGLLGVDQRITREQAATVLVRASALEAEALSRPQAEAEAIVNRYTDKRSISGWAIPYVAQAYVSNSMLGDVAGTFRPLDILSKGEATTVAVCIKDLRKLLDFGHAPEYAPFFKFPSLLASNGARHADYGRFEWLGRRVDGEIDSRQVNADFFDDGLLGYADASGHPVTPPAGWPPASYPATISLLFQVSTVWPLPAGMQPPTRRAPFT